MFNMSHLIVMKKVGLFLFTALALSGCASDPVFRPIKEKGTACVQDPDTENKVVCTPIRMYEDPNRFHYVRPWETLGEIPDLP